MDGSTNTHKWPDRPVTIIGMPVAVRELRIQGRRITKEEYAEALPLVGRLRLVDNAGGNGMHRGKAMHLDRAGPGEIGSVRPPLFDPVLESMDAKGFVLKGYEISYAGGKTFEHRQAWLVRPLPE